MPDTAAGRPHGVVAVAGEALVDIVPAPAQGYWEFAPGGSPANVAVGLARQGHDVRLLTRLGRDARGERIAVQVRALCEKYNLPYNTGGFFKQIGSVWGKIFKLALPPSLVKSQTPPSVILERRNAAA